MRDVDTIIESVGVTVMQVVMTCDMPVVSAQHEQMTTNNIAELQGFSRPAWTLPCGCHQAVSAVADDSHRLSAIRQLPRAGEWTGNVSKIVFRLPRRRHSGLPYAKQRVPESALVVSLEFSRGSWRLRPTSRESMLFLSVNDDQRGCQGTAGSPRFTKALQ